MLVALKAAMRLRAPMPGGSAVNILELEDETKVDVFTVDGDGAIAQGTNFVINSSGQITTAAGETPIDYVELDLADWYRVWTGTNASFDPRINGGSYPYLDSNTISPAIVWPQYHHLDADDPANQGSGHSMARYLVDHRDDEGLSPIQTSFRVPDNYRTGGTFRFIMHQDEGLRGDNTTGTAVHLGYRVFKSTVDGYWDQTAAVHIPERVGPTEGYMLSPVEVIFSITGTDATFVAGQIVCFQYWRIRDQNTVDKLRHLTARFYFNSKY